MLLHTNLVPRVFVPLDQRVEGTKTLGARLATHIIMRSLFTMFISAMCVKRVIYTEVYFCSFVAEISSKLVLSFSIPKMIYILIRYPTQTNIKHLSCNKQPQLGCVNTSRVRTKRTGNAEN